MTFLCVGAVNPSRAKNDSYTVGFKGEMPPQESPFLCQKSYNNYKGISWFGINLSSRRVNGLPFSCLLEMLVVLWIFIWSLSSMNTKIKQKAKMWMGWGCSAFAPTTLWVTVWLYGRALCSSLKLGLEPSKLSWTGTNFLSEREMFLIIWWLLLSSFPF